MQLRLGMLGLLHNNPFERSWNPYFDDERGEEMSLKHGLLGLLNYEPMTGYELNKTFKESLGNFWHATASQIYRELDEMEKRGWLTSTRVIQEDKPNKRVYSIADDGYAELVEWLKDSGSDKPPQPPKSAFLVRMFFSGEMGKEATLRLLREKQTEVAQAANKLEGARKTANDAEAELGAPAAIALGWRLTVLSGEINLRAASEWLEKSIEIVEALEE